VQLTEQVDSDQQMQLTEQEELRDILMIGGIGIFLPFSQEEAEIYVAGGAATIEEQSVETVKEELEQVFETAQAEAEADEGENEHSEECLIAFSQEAEEAVALELTAEEAGGKEHSEEWLNDFSQGAEKKEAVALKLAAKEAKEQAGRFITPWEMELEMLKDWLNNPGPTRELTEVELSEKVTEQPASQRETAEQRSATEWQLEATDEDEEEGMGDHDDLPNCRKFLQLRRLQKRDQPLEQLDKEIEDIRRLMLRSAETASEEQLSRRKEAAAAQQKAATAGRWSRWEAPDICLGSRRISNR
jgi:hypothetical protein